MNETTQIVLGVGVPVIILLIGFISGYALKYIKLGFDKLSSKVGDNEILKTYIDIVKENAVIIVESLNQTLVNDLKAKSEDGKLTEDEIKDISESALNTMYDMLSSDALDILQNAYDDLDVFFKNTIESALYNVKKES